MVSTPPGQERSFDEIVSGSTPLPGRVPAPRTRRAPARVFVALLAIGLALGGYTAACALAPLPDLTPVAADAVGPVTVDGVAAQAAVDEESLPTAIAWSDGEDVWSNSDAAYPLASLSKLVTVLVGLDEQPLEPGDPGPTYTWTHEDTINQSYLAAVDGIAYPIPEGTEVTMHDMLALTLLPSANDFATAYAHWVFGDNDTFLAAVEDWADRHGLDSLTFVEPSGMDESNRASPADLARIARLALDNPTMSELHRTPAAEVPGVAAVENTNPLLGELPGVIGVKTGTSYSAGYNFIAAQEITVGERETVKITVTLGRESAEARAESAVVMLSRMDTLPEKRDLVHAGEALGWVDSWEGERVELLAASDEAAVLLPGETASREVELRPVEPGPAWQPIGTVTLSSPDGEREVDVLALDALPEPDLWWRLTHPLALLP